MGSRTSAGRSPGQQCNSGSRLVKLGSRQGLFLFDIQRSEIEQPKSCVNDAETVWSGHLKCKQLVRKWENPIEGHTSELGSNSSHPLLK